MTAGRKSVGIRIVDSSDITVTGNRFLGVDVGIDAARIQTSVVNNNTILGPETIRLFEHVDESIRAAKVENPDFDPSHIVETVQLIAQNPRAEGLAMKIRLAIESAQPYMSLAAALTELAHGFGLL
jgi:hypothetical protein